ncbi:MULTISPECIES: catecholate siderophore receptor Fiu [Hydrocarboniphaga]|uniref:catecholate siderophore receptor Fiu n=1 Tax=Hydrocarboniphaga TaxID=243627 RepID=UPI00058DC81A|nr:MULTISPECIES: catecholate siderophore receptor Fiu [Hydrocarboniphaga]MDZ4080705.1 catecholate siderophore receptor Fiu [Hydrocarboniphaga sp.]
MLKFRLRPLAAAALVVYAVPGFAQEASETPATNERAVALPQVKVEDKAEQTYKAETVSSPKFTEPLVNTPQTITVIKKELLQERVATTLTEALRNTPGITLQQGENGNSTSGDAISMRGFDTQNSIFIDNVRDLGTAVRDVFNVEQIEVVKGPSGADNGRGATAGYINLSSKLPSAEDFKAGTVSYGSEDRRRVTADLNQTLGEKTAVRLNLMGQDGGVAGRDFIERKSWGIAPSVAFGLGTETRFYLFSQHVRQDNTPDGGVTTLGLPGYRYPNSVPQPIQQVVDAGGGLAAPNSKNYYGFAQDFEDIKANMLTAKFEHDLAPGFVVRNTARYGKSEQERVLTGINAATITNGAFGQNADPAANPPRPEPTPPPNGLTLRNPEDMTVTRSIQATGRVNEIMTNQTNLTGTFKTGIVEHSLGGGVEFIYERQYTPSYGLAPGTTQPTEVTTANLYNPDRNVTRLDYAKTGGYTDGQTITTAAYLFDTLHITDRWLINGSLRWERYETETEAVTAAASGTPPAYVLTAVPRIEAADNLLSWKAGVLFKPTSISSVYASYANSYQPPGGANFSLSATATNIANPNLDPQEAENYELGTKWDLFGGRLAATAAVFQSTNKNELARAGDNPDIVIQYGKRETKGVELALVGEVLPNWNVSAGITKQKAEITQGTTTPGATQSDGAGARFTPEWNATLWTTYRLVPYKLTFGAGVQYVDDMVRQENNNPNGTVNAASGQVGYTGIYKVSSYTLVDAMVTYEATKNLSVQLNGYNLFDEDYVAAVNNGGSRYLPGTARSYLVSLNVKF